MEVAFLGILKRHGLVWFVPEEPASHRFILRRLARLPARSAIGCWAVLDARDAHRVGLLTRRGQPGAALRLLNQTATWSGHLAAPDETSSTELAG